MLQPLAGQMDQLLLNYTRGCLAIQSRGRGPGRPVGGELRPAWAERKPTIHLDPITALPRWLAPGEALRSVGSQHLETAELRSAPAPDRKTGGPRYLPIGYLPYC